MQERTLRTGPALHARPLDHFVRAARHFSCKISLRHKGKEADGKNVVQLLLLGVPAGGEVTLGTEGDDETAALETLGRALTESEGPGGAEPEDRSATLPTGQRLGIPGAPGVGVGRVRAETTLQNRASWRAPASAAEEHRTLQRALTMARRATEALMSTEDPFADIFSAQRTVLDDPDLLAALVRHVDDGASAAGAVVAEFASFERRFAALGSRFAAERHADIADVRDRILTALGLWPAEDAEEERGDGAAPEPIVLLVREATPSGMVLLDGNRVAAVISLRGGPTSHAAIVARGRGIPLVFAETLDLQGIKENEHLMVDGGTGAITHLTPEAAAATRAAQVVTAAASPGAARFAGTSDGRRISIRANLGAPGDLALAKEAGGEGCGLLRTELLYAGRLEAPTVKEQAEAYARVARALAPHPTVVRLFDAGSDKPLAFLPGPDDEPNPALGRRGLRLLLDHPAVLSEQLEAVAEARRISGCDLRALVPLVTDVAELAALRALHVEGCPIGAMIETPAAALLAGAIARRVDFLSVGTNDLAQYVLASDRLRASRARLSLHPALLRLLHRVLREARDAGVECSVCGEAAGDPLTAGVLVGLGVTVLSVAPARIRVLRESLARLRFEDLASLAEEALTVEDPRHLENLLQSPRPGAG